MTDYEKRIAVAEAWPIMNCHLCGYPNCSPAKAQFCSATHYDPINDLNAMHGAWSTLNRQQRISFSRDLREVVVNDGGHASSFQEDIVACVENATSPQRCEAFLRTHGKLKDQ